MQSREIIPTVVALRQRFESIRRSELNRLESKLAGLPPDARAMMRDYGDPSTPTTTGASAAGAAAGALLAALGIGAGAFGEIGRAHV